ncbi:uncharacterized protein [Rutidosis leptorrhynchoides]|uniref:uncharacterized protein n=1 Tax=Rutidosis leptorrhynchoides TaxID=125765 RepID=UPI003A98EA7B
MSDDIPLRVAASFHMSKIYINPSELESYVLYELQILLHQQSKSVSDFGLPKIPQHLLDDLQNRLIMEEKNFDREALIAEKLILESKMNDKQQMIYNMVISSNSSKKQELIFVYGHGGTGKTFLWKAITTALRAEGKIVLAVASSGIASLLLSFDQTAYSRFKIPLDLTDESMCNIKKQTNMASLLKKTEMIIWDEVPMNDRKCLEALDRTLRDIYDILEVPFGGLTFVLGGDFRQTLPLKKGCGKQKENVANFAEWLLQIGNGSVGIPDKSDLHNVSWIEIPEKFCIQHTKESLQQLISFIYDEELLRNPDAMKLQQQAIICPKNETVDIINNMIMRKKEGQQKTYTSCDSATPYSNDGGQTELLYPTEYLNCQNFPGLPPHELSLKIGVPIILLRNLNVAGGLCNGTRMIVTQLLSNLIEGEIIT